jgi:DNA-binding transcriptional MerR regulator
LRRLQNYPLYSIGVVSELLGVHAETIRLWEKSGVVQPPQRRSGKRFYSEKDYRRLQFIHTLAQEGLTLRAIHYYLRLYPCWKTDDCPSSLHSSDQIASTKPCWQEAGTYCQVANSENPCASCQIGAREEPYPAQEIEIGTGTRQQHGQEAESAHYSRAGRRRLTEPTGTKPPAPKRP